MKTSIEKLENSKVKLEIEVDEKEFDKSIQKAYMKLRGSIHLPGFRKGKAPRPMIERFYGVEVFYEEALNDILPISYDKAIEENNLFPVENPEFDISQIEKGKNLIFTAEVTLKPDVTLGEYKGIEVTEVKRTVSDDEVDLELENLRNQNARWIAVEDRPIENGDMITLDYKGFADDEAFDGGTAENQSLEIGSGSFIPGFEEQLVGMNAGDEGSINVIFPEEYHSEDLKGKEAVFEVKIHEIKEKELPELDDEFIIDISEFDTLEEYKEDAKAKMQERADDESKSTMENELLTKIAENASVEIPEVMVETQIDSSVREMEMNMRYQGMELATYLQMLGQNINDFREQMRDGARNRVKLQLTLEKIVEEMGIEVSEEDLEAEYETIAEAYGMEVDRIKATYVGRDDEIKNNLAVQKAVEVLMDEAKIVEASEVEETDTEADEAEEIEETEDVKEEVEESDDEKEA